MPDSTYDVAPVLFSDLKALNPDHVCRRALCQYDAGRGCYSITIFGRPFEIYPEKQQVITPDAATWGSYPYLSLFAVHYLLTVKAADPAGVWISEKEIPGGEAFFRGPHALPLGLITRRFGNDPDAFGRACRRLGGTPLDMADAAFRLDITPRIPAAVLYWAGDEDFGAQARILFDKTISIHLAPDIVYALGVDICRQVAGK